MGYNYDSQEAWDAVHGLSESFQYYLIKASNQLAKEKGWCENFGRTKYADGILPIDTYKKDVDEIITQEDYNMIGKVLEHLSWNRSTALNTVCSDAIGEQFRCVKRNKWNRTT